MRDPVVFTLYLSAQHNHTKKTLNGTLNLCDLAGSERIAKSGVATDKDRLKETQNINKSLSSLSDVFLALSTKSSHIPFRNSKLTYLLQPCLSGDGKTAMIVNINPSLSSAGETLCSLRFASQVSQVVLGAPKKNQSSSHKDEDHDRLFVPPSPAPLSTSVLNSSMSTSVTPSKMRRPSSALTTMSSTTPSKKQAIGKTGTGLKF
jgi:hypothetical protein